MELLIEDLNLAGVSKPRSMISDNSKINNRLDSD